MNHSTRQAKITLYLDVPTTDANAMVALKRELKCVDYKIPCEERKEDE